MSNRFVQTGVGDYRVDRFGSYLGIGLTAVGVIEGRATDELGIGLAHARNGSHYMSATHAGPPSDQRRIDHRAHLSVSGHLVAGSAIRSAICGHAQHYEGDTQRIRVPFQLRIEMSF